MWNLKYDTSDLTYKTDSETEKTPRVAGGEGLGRDGPGLWAEQTRVHA